MSLGASEQSNSYSHLNVASPKALQGTIPLEIYSQDYLDPLHHHRCRSFVCRSTPKHSCTGSHEKHFSGGEEDNSNCGVSNSLCWCTISPPWSEITVDCNLTENIISFALLRIELRRTHIAITFELLCCPVSQFRFMERNAQKCKQWIAGVLCDSVWSIYLQLI